MKQKKSIVHKITISYLCVFLFALIGGLIINYQYTTIINNKIEQYNLTVLRQVQSVLDEKFEAIEKRLSDLSYNTIINFYLMYANFDGAPRTGEYYYNMYRVTKMLSGIPLNKWNYEPSYHLKLYLYHFKSDTVLDGLSKYSVDYFYDNIMQYPGLSLDKWRDNQRGFHYYFYFPASEVFLDGEPKRVITCLNTLPLGSFNTVYGTIGLVIDAKPLESILWESTMDGAGVSFILDKNNRILLSAGNKELITDDIVQLAEQASDGSVRNIKGTNIIITTLSSSNNKFTYISAVPSSVYMEEVNYIRHSTVFWTAIMMVSGFLLSILFAKKNTTPIRNLVTLLQRHSHKDMTEYKSEFDFIEQTALTALTETNDIRKAMDSYQPLLQNGLISKLLQGSHMYTRQFDYLLEMSGLNFDKTRFVVIMLGLETEKCEESGFDPHLAKFSAINVLKEMLDKTGNLYICEFGLDTFCILLNTNIEENLSKTLIDILSQAMEILAKKLGVYLKCGIGTIRQTQDEIHLSYHEAHLAFEYCNYNPQSSIQYFGDIDISTHTYSYPIEVEIQLIYYVKNGNKAKMREIIRSIINKNYTKTTLPLTLARCLFFDIMSTALKIVHEVGIDSFEAFDNDPVSLLTSCKNIDDMEQTLYVIFDILCEKSAEKRSEHNQKLKTEVLEYINQNYQNPNLSLSTIASVFHLSPSYLSRFLKEYAGVNFTDYLRNRRIEKSMHYLWNTNYSINEIAEIVGYTSSIVFIRNFKKLHGITPGEMRLCEDISD